MREQKKQISSINIIFIIPYPQLEKSIKHMIRGYLAEHREKQVQVSLLYIVPWDEQEVSLLSGKSAEEFQSEDEDTRYLVVNRKKPIDGFISAYIKKLDFEYDVMIARGNLSDKLRESMSVPVIDIPFTGYDVIYSLMECRKKYQPRNIAVIGRHHVVCHAKGLGKLINCGLNVYEVAESSGLEQQMKNALKDGCDAVIGGYTTAIFARSCGLHAVVMGTGAEAIRMALEEALHMVAAVRKERELSETYRIIAQAAQDGMIYVNSEKIIAVINKAAEQICAETEKDLVGLPLKNAFPYLAAKADEAMENKKEISNELHHYEDMTLLAGYLPVIVDEQAVGVVIHMQNVSKIQDTESQVRKKMSQRGLRAKYHLEDVLHKSLIMEKTLDMARRYARVSSNIMIVGETGTGKELIAQGIHNLSNRREQPFVAVNCAALTENLLESELFGYVGGAFTGASKGGKMGLFELAHNGTIFLDEISEIPLNFQSKLLRVLQEREIRRIGDDKIIPIDVRIIAATNRNLQRMVSQGKFRKDLLYRLNILRLYVPPLRNRKEDIGLLFENFLQEYVEKFGREPIKMSEEALEELTSYDFSGNVRELRNMAERLSVLYSGQKLGKEEIAEAIFPEDVEEPMMASSKEKMEAGMGDEESLLMEMFGSFLKKREDIYREVLEKSGSDMQDTKGWVEKELIQKTLKECGCNQGEAARILGIDRSTLWRKIKKYGL